MGGCSLADECEFTSPLTLVLDGRTGNGKSATGNSILGAKKFESKRSSSGVTCTSQLKTTILDDGRVLNVIDTPGLFDSSIDHEFIGKEIVSCIDMARNGINAVLLVFSVCNRFSEEEKAAISSLLTVFGRKIYDYTIVVFTGGDELEDEGKTLDDFLSNCSRSLKDILNLFGDRYLLFNNKTQDEAKRLSQVHKLLSLVNTVLLNNSGKPYSNEMFNEFKKYHREGDQEDSVVRDEQFKRILEMVESRLMETNLKLEQLLAEERAACLEAVRKKSDEEILKMKEKIESAKKREKEERLKREEEKQQQKKDEEEQRRKREEEKRKQEEHFRQREEQLRRQGCVIL